MNGTEDGHNIRMEGAPYTRSKYQVKEDKTSVAIYSTNSCAKDANDNRNAQRT